VLELEPDLGAALERLMARVQADGERKKKR